MGADPLDHRQRSGASRRDGWGSVRRRVATALRRRAADGAIPADPPGSRLHRAPTRRQRDVPVWAAHRSRRGQLYARHAAVTTSRERNWPEGSAARLRPLCAVVFWWYRAASTSRRTRRSSTDRSRPEAVPTCARRTLSVQHAVRRCHDEHAARKVAAPDRVVHQRVERRAGVRGKPGRDGERRYRVRGGRAWSCEPER